MATVQVVTGETPLNVSAIVNEVTVAEGQGISVVSPEGNSIQVSEGLGVSVSTELSTVAVTVGQAPIYVKVDNPTSAFAGPQGPRGSTFLGGYPSLVNLPAIDGVNVKVGDFALVRDTGTMYQVQ